MSNPNGTKFARDELVTVTIRGRVINTWESGADKWVSVKYDRTRGDVDVNLTCSGVIVERVAPAEWPPKTGDVWEDRNKAKWFGTDRGHGIRLTGATGDTWSDYGEVLRDVGPMRLLYRDGWTPAIETTPAEAAKVSYADGLRAMADWIDDHPEMRAPYSITHRTYAGGAHGQVSFDTLAELEQVAARFGVTLEDHDVQVRGTLPVPGGSSITIVWFAPEPTATQPDEPVEDDRADADPEAPTPAPQHLPLLRSDPAVNDLPHRAPDADAASVLAQSLADGAA